VFIAASGPGQGQVREHRLEAKDRTRPAPSQCPQFICIALRETCFTTSAFTKLWEIKMPGLQQHYDRLVALRADARAKRQAILDRCERDNRDQLTMDETRSLTAQSSSTTTAPLGS
jgi:hypothetical protein